MLLRVAREAIQVALGMRQSVILPTPLDARLGVPGASFVTLSASAASERETKQLRGCIGTLEAYQALIEDVMHNARAAAMRDPRFTPVTPEELASLEISISVLEPPHALLVSGTHDLYEQIAQDKPGVIVEYWQHGSPTHKATFLPSVWQQTPTPEHFIRELKRKAGIEADFWSSDLRWYSYHTQSFSEHSNTHSTAHGKENRTAL